ncbi:MAG: isopentenyl transferase family protein [Patescibacteria group bacterium]
MHLIVLLGQTSSGKSEMAVNLAKYLGNIWIVNCDSRQIYKQLDIGTGKVNGTWKDSTFYYQDIPHFLIDYIDPETTDYTLVNYVKDFNSLFKSKLLPEYVILTGGTGLYAKAIVEKYNLGIVKSEFTDQYNSYKKSLISKSLEQLQSIYNSSLKTRVKLSNKVINNSDYHNPRRLFSRILKAKASKNGWLESISYPNFTFTSMFGIFVDQKTLEEKIKKRLDSRIQSGLINEVRQLQRLGRDRMLNLGLEYRLSQLYIEKIITEEEWRRRLLIENYQYAKRQLTWLKKQPDLIWINSLEQLLDVINSSTLSPTKP